MRWSLRITAGNIEVSGDRLRRFNEFTFETQLVDEEAFLLELLLEFLYPRSIRGPFLDLHLGLQRAMFELGQRLRCSKELGLKALNSLTELVILCCKVAPSVMAAGSRNSLTRLEVLQDTL